MLLLDKGTPVLSLFKFAVLFCNRVLVHVSMGCVVLYQCPCSSLSWLCSHVPVSLFRFKLAVCMYLCL